MKTLQDPSSTMGFTFTLVRKANGLGRSLGWEDPLEKEMATHSNCPGNPIAWKIPWTEEPGRLQSTGSQKVRHDGATSLSLSRVGTSSQTKLRTLPHEETGCGLSFWSQLMAYPLPTTDQPGHYEKSSHASSHIRPRSSNSLSPLSETFKVQMYELA